MKRTVCLAYLLIVMGLYGCRPNAVSPTLVQTGNAAPAATDLPAIEQYRSAAEVKATDESEKERGITFPKLVRGNPARKEIALTFDDGPHPDYTPRLLELLAREKVPATFFVIGKMVDKHPELVQREAAEGHQVANHTYDHIRLVGLPQRQAQSEIIRGSDAIARAIGKPTRYYRPPGGEYDATVIAATKAAGSTMVLWTDDPGDYADPGADTIASRTIKTASNGAILLLHDGAKQTLPVLPEIIRTLKAQGYVFVTIADLAREPGDVITGGPKVLPKPSPKTSPAPDMSPNGGKP